MKVGAAELNFAEIDIKNPFSITESTLTPMRRSSVSSLNDSFPHPTDIQNESQDNILVNKKSNRGKKLDNFDYNSKIQEELQRLGESAADEASKKKLIQKIRNRISANRSRLRLKSEVETLKEENENLIIVIQDLEAKLDHSSNENQVLKQKLFETGYISHPMTPQAEPANYYRTKVNINKSYVKNTFFIATILIAVAMLGNSTINRVKMGGAVPLLSLNGQKTKTRNATVTEFCKKQASPTSECASSKIYLYKLKQKVNKKINNLTELNKTLPQYKVKDFMTEIISFSCQSSDNKGKKIERVFLFDKEVVREARKNTEALYVSETWPIEYVHN